MRALIIDDEFGLDNLKFVDRPSPAPGPGQLKLSMRSASLNYRDLLMVNGLYNPRQPLPLVPCSDGVGQVVAIGDGVDEAWLNKRVMPIFAQRWHSGRPTRDKLSSTLGGPLDGVLQEEMVLSADSVVEVPEHLSDAEAATLPCAGLTAWNALLEQGQVKAGDTVLTLGTGGVSIFAVQFASLVGADVIATSSSDEKLARVAKLGARRGINYKADKKWGKTARQMSGGLGVDLVIEVGGAGTLEQSVRALRPGGQISLIGVLSGGVQEFNVIPVLMQNIRIQGVIVGHREMFENMVRAIDGAGLTPVVDEVFGFDQVRQAFTHMAAGAHFGKICIDLTGREQGEADGAKSGPK